MFGLSYTDSLLFFISSGSPFRSPTKSPTKLPTSSPTKLPTRLPTKSPTSVPQAGKINIYLTLDLNRIIVFHKVLNCHNTLFVYFKLQ